MDGSNSTTIWEAEAKDNFGNITQYNLGNGLQTTKTYDNNTGMLTQIKTGTSNNNTTVQYLNYEYDNLYNITQRKDVLSNQQDLFTYDNFNRLTDIQTYKDADNPTTSITKHMAYDNVGNITHKDDVGDMTYGGLGTANSSPTGSNPYAITEIDNNPNTITTPQNILYTSFNKVRKITTSDEDGSNAKELNFVYGADYGRRKTTYVVNNILITKKYYAFGNYEETVDASNVSTKDYFIYGGDGVAAIYRITGTTTPGTMYYIHKDNLGSFDKVTNSSGTVVDSYSFDAWGNRRSTSDWTAAETGVTHLFNRGFTGHEHLDEFGLINMNGRCYDPLLGRILSPDPDLQDPSNIQNYNRYSYCLNNPLKYTDPSGYYIYGHTQTLFSLPSFNHVAQFYDNAGDFMDLLQARLEFEQDDLYAMIAQGTGNGNNAEDKSNTNVNTSSPSYYGNSDEKSNSEAKLEESGGIPYSWDYIESQAYQDPANGDDPKKTANGIVRYTETWYLGDIQFCFNRDVYSPETRDTYVGLIYNPETNKYTGTKYDVSNIFPQLQFLPILNSVTLNNNGSFSIGIGLTTIGTNSNYYTFGAGLPIGIDTKYSFTMGFDKNGVNNSIYYLSIGTIMSVVAPMETPYIVFRFILSLY